ncbi:unnamed protein product [Acanthoscelides obtectus]|uniref:Uncharacterized protein n=1 Tax=Acanthoscelides obtectus TaxID=200917 RepID=A0A9P0Q1P3_ACAOB|nr:unnamed protein product [Acanthoscelides obtectus]CAK1663159.1 hypothetical protein AOBTE_LOCUS23521 [Acanthoscelides obtectus]
MLKRTNFVYLHLVVTSKSYTGSTKQIFFVPNEETRGGVLSCIHKMKICLRCLGDPRYQQGIGQELGVSQATVSRTVDRVVNSKLHSRSNGSSFQLPTMN